MEGENESENYDLGNRRQNENVSQQSVFYKLLHKGICRFSESRSVFCRRKGIPSLSPS